MSETRNHTFITPNLQKTLDKLLKDEAKTHRTVSRLHCLDSNKRLNGLLSEVYGSDLSAIKEQKFLIMDALYGKKFPDAFDYFNAETLDAFNFCISSMITYYHENYKSLIAPIPMSALHECIIIARRKAIQTTLFRYDEKDFGIEQDKAYLPTIKEPNTRKDVLDYLDPEHVYDCSLKNVEKQYEEEQAELAALQKENENVIYDIYDNPIPAEAEGGYIDDKGNEYYIYDDKVYYPKSNEDKQTVEEDSLGL